MLQGRHTTSHPRFLSTTSTQKFFKTGYKTLDNASFKSWRGHKMENLRIKLNFYKIISYLVDRCNSPAPSRSRQTLEKNVLSWALAWTGSVVFTRQVSPDTQLPYCACARMRTSSFCCLPSKVPLI